MHLWTLAFLFGHLALVGAAPEGASEASMPAVAEKGTGPAASGKMATSGGKMAAANAHLLTSPCTATTTAVAASQTAHSTVPSASQPVTTLASQPAAMSASQPAATSASQHAATSARQHVATTSASQPAATLASQPAATSASQHAATSARQPVAVTSASQPAAVTSSAARPGGGTSQTSAPIVLTGSTQIAAGGPTGNHPVSVGGGGAEILIVDANGTSTPIMLEVGDEIIVAGGGPDDTSRRPPAGGGEILIGNSEQNATIVLSAGDQIVFATSNGARTESDSSIVLGGGTEIKVAGPPTAGSPIILSNGTEVLTDHYSDTDESDNPVVTAENETTSTTTTTAAPINVTQSNATELDVVSGAPGVTTQLPNPMTVVISLDSSSYTWARWSAWYCNCANSSMSRIRGIVDKSTGITLHYNEYQPSHFQREPCNYKVCECSRKAKQCHSTNVTCLEPDPYYCVLSDITYQEIMDSKDYWKKLKKGAQALYHKIKSFLKQNADEET